MKRVLVLALPLALLAASGCGGSDVKQPPVDKTNLPGSALNCLEANNIPARQTGENGDELVLDAGPKITFYLTADEAIAEQFRGRGEGAEQIGTALLFVPPETSKKNDDLLHAVEVCLARL
ncbi:MAG TPA: hypothetical protein VF072_13695 [Thermoleophilaceae bacterium]